MAASLLIIGAGPTGLTMALAARQRGLDCRLVEQAAQPSEHSKALAIQARTLEVLERLGIADAFLGEAVRPIGLDIRTASGRTRIAIEQLHPRFPTLVILPQDRTERLLISAGAAPQRGVTCLGVEEGAARLRHEDGREERARADWIIACDGPHSIVRKAVGLDFGGSRYAEDLVLADCRGAGLEPDRITVVLQPGGLLAFFPIGGDRWRALRVLPPGVAVGDRPDLAAFATPGVRLDDLVWFSRFKISRRQVKRIRVGRVLLAGDAAHIHSPFGGQGMNLGMQDAYALAAAIAAGDAAIDRWAAERHAVATRTLRATDRGTRLLFAHGGGAALLRQLAFAGLATIGPLRRRLQRGLAGLDYPAIPA